MHPKCIFFIISSESRFKMTLENVRFDIWFRKSNRPLAICRHRLNAHILFIFRFDTYALFLEPDFLTCVSLIFIKIICAISLSGCVVVCSGDFQQFNKRSDYRIVVWHLLFYLVRITVHNIVAANIRVWKHVCVAVQFLEFPDTHLYSGVTSVNLSNLTCFLNRRQKVDYGSISFMK